MMIFFFIQITKIKHSLVMIYFSNEEEKEKGRFTALISSFKWYTKLRID